MGLSLLLIASVCLAFSGPDTQHARGWSSIVPLHSTRKDVEQLLGRAEKQGRISTYRTGKELVRVEFVVSPCKGSIPGWDVPPDTVLQLEVVSQGRELFPALGIDKSKYVKANGYSARTHYLNLEDGIRYEVFQNGTINSVSYIPSSKDTHLRCTGFPPYTGEVIDYRPDDTYGDIPLADEEARLDNFAFSLQNGPAAKAYIIVYAGRRAVVGEAKTRAQCAREYLINKRGIDAGRVIAVDGGYREEVAIELYFVPGELPAPAPTPTVISSEVQIIKETSKEKGTNCSPRPCRK